MRADAEGLAASTADTAGLAEKVSRKVRQLDLAQSRVAATLERIGLVVDRQRAIEGIQSALAAEDYEGAGECVARYLELEDLFGGALAEGDARQAQEQAKVRGGTLCLHCFCSCIYRWGVLRRGWQRMMAQCGRKQR